MSLAAMSGPCRGLTPDTATPDTATADMALKEPLAVLAEGA